MFQFWRPRNRVVDMRVENRNESSVTLVVEPWARELKMPSQGTATIRFEGPDPIQIEVETETDRLTVYGWVGPTISNDTPSPST